MHMYFTIMSLWEVSPFGHQIKCPCILVHSQQNALDYSSSEKSESVTSVIFLVSKWLMSYAMIYIYIYVCI